MAVSLLQQLVKRVKLVKLANIEDFKRYCSLRPILGSCLSRIFQRIYNKFTKNHRKSLLFSRQLLQSYLRVAVIILHQLVKRVKHGGFEVARFCRLAMDRFQAYLQVHCKTSQVCQIMNSKCSLDLIKKNLPPVQVCTSL